MTERNDPATRRLLTRRQALAASSVLGLYLLGCGETSRTRSSSSGSAASSSATSCVLTPEQTEGPYYIEDGLVRRDITEGREGVPLELRLAVQDAAACRPIRGATVEVWHCDALGVYSGFTAAGSGGGAGAPGGVPPPGGGPPTAGDGGRAPTDDATYLRGAQRSGAAGVVGFRTIYPGWYQGRTPHIHLKVHVGGEEVHTGQLYFDDAVTDAVYRRAPYRAHGPPATTNSSDGIYADGGVRSTLSLSRAGAGYIGRLTLGVRSS